MLNIAWDTTLERLNGVTVDAKIGDSIAAWKKAASPHLLARLGPFRSTQGNALHCHSCKVLLQKGDQRLPLESSGDSVIEFDRGVQPQIIAVPRARTLSSLCDC
jgi:hypothetical protein